MAQRNHPLGLGEWENRVDECFSHIIQFRLTDKEAHDKIHKMILLELHRKTKTRAAYPEYVKGYVNGMKATLHRLMWKNDFEFCYVKDDILYSTHKTSIHRSIETFFISGRGYELGNLPSGFVWKGTSKWHTSPSVRHETSATDQPQGI